MTTWQLMPCRGFCLPSVRAPGGDHVHGGPAHVVLARGGLLHIRIAGQRPVHMRDNAMIRECASVYTLATAPSRCTRLISLMEVVRHA